MILATEEVASERMEEVSTPSRLTLVEMLRHGIFSSSSFCFFLFVSLSITRSIPSLLLKADNKVSDQLYSIFNLSSKSPFYYSLWPNVSGPNYTIIYIYIYGVTNHFIVLPLS